MPTRTALPSTRRISTETPRAGKANFSCGRRDRTSMRASIPRCSTTGLPGSAGSPIPVSSLIPPVRRDPRSTIPDVLASTSLWQANPSPKSERPRSGPTSRRPHCKKRRFPFKPFCSRIQLNCTRGNSSDSATLISRSDVEAGFASSRRAEQVGHQVLELGLGDLLGQVRRHGRELGGRSLLDVDLRARGSPCPAHRP